MSFAQLLNFDVSCIAMSVVKVLLVVIIGVVATIAMVPYNINLTGVWNYNDNKLWLSRTPWGNYTIHDISDDMNHIGTLQVDRLLNINKYFVNNPTDAISDIGVDKVTISTMNSKTEMFGDPSGNLILTMV